MTILSIDESIEVIGKHIKLSTSAYLCKYKKNQRLDLIQSNCICYLESGSVSVNRKDNSVVVTTLNAPAILGLTQMRSEMKHHYFRCDDGCKMWIINTQCATNMFTHKNLWEHAFNILNVTISNYLKRESLINAPNTREIICKCLEHIWLMPSDLRAKTSVYSFIMSRNHISRSMIHKVIQDMSGSFNIRVEKGKLVYYNNW